MSWRYIIKMPDATSQHCSSQSSALDTCQVHLAVQLLLYVHKARCRWNVPPRLRRIQDACTQTRSCSPSQCRLDRRRCNEMPGGRQAMENQVIHVTAGDQLSTRLQEVSRLHIEMLLNKSLLCTVNRNTHCQQHSHSTSLQHGQSAE